MSPLDLEHLRARVIVEELVRGGVRLFVLSPGSRNSPLVVAACEARGAETIVHPDERGAAYYAVGHAKATGRPAAVIGTSGTAVANYLPAVIEASSSSMPLVLLTADRPIELLETAANQTIDQRNIFGPFVRWRFDLPAPAPDTPLRFVLTTVDQALFRTTAAPAGPVQLNCRFHRPLAPGDGGAIPPDMAAEFKAWEGSGAPYTVWETAGPSVGPDTIESVRRQTGRSCRGVIVAGPGSSNAGARRPILEAAAALGWPLLADIGSGLRFGKDVPDTLLTHFDLFLGEPRLAERLRPDIILQMGGTPVSATLQEWLESAGATWIRSARSPRRLDPGHRVTHRIVVNPAVLFRALADTPAPGGSDLLSPLREADRRCRDALSDLLDNEAPITEPGVARILVETLPDPAALFLANSMPVRDADACGGASERDIIVGMNRGASGIDGTLSAAAGFAAGLGHPTAVLTGDLAFLHDLDGLLRVRDSAIPITIVLVNNDGGGIFSFLPIAGRTEHFERAFAAPHGLGFREVAGAFGLEHRSPRTAAEFRDACRAAFAGGRSGIIEIHTDRAENVAEHRRIRDRVAEALRGILGDRHE